MLKKAASVVLGPLSCSRTAVYAPLAQVPAALLDLTLPRRAGLFEHPAGHLLRLEKSTVPESRWKYYFS